MNGWIEGLLHARHANSPARVKGEQAENRSGDPQAHDQGLGPCGPSLLQVRPGSPGSQGSVLLENSTGVCTTSALAAAHLLALQAPPQVQARLRRAGGGTWWKRRRDDTRFEKGSEHKNQL